MTNGDNACSIHADWLGTERARSTSSGAGCETTVSLPFGDGMSTSGSCGDPSPLHFTGKQRDTESNLDYFGARYYGSAQGRFLTPDPKLLSQQRIFDPQQWSMYGHARNNPLKFVDPTGRELKVAVFLEGGGVSRNTAETGVMRAANDIHKSGVKNVTAEFHEGKPDPKTLNSLNKEKNTLVIRIQDPSEKSLAAKATEKMLGGQTVGESEKTTNVVHIYPLPGSTEGMQANEISNVTKHEDLHQAGESFVSDYTNKEPGNVMDPQSYNKDVAWKDLTFSAAQGQELQNRYNKPGEVDQNPNAAVCTNCAHPSPKGP